MAEKRSMTQDEVKKLGLTPEQCEALGIEVTSPNGGGTGKTMTLIVDAGDPEQIKRAMAFGFSYEELAGEDEEGEEGEGGGKGDEDEGDEQPRRKGYFKD